MALETKVMLQMLADQVANSDSVEKAYLFIMRAANAKGLNLQPIEEVRALYRGEAYGN
ncbi:MAG: hypothetical protein LBE35_08995 [Clostridiales bacterium]|nr:hypothetical protein [Clostridiales bacterium]